MVFVTVRLPGTKSYVSVTLAVPMPPAPMVTFCGLPELTTVTAGRAVRRLGHRTDGAGQDARVLLRHRASGAVGRDHERGLRDTAADHLDRHRALVTGRLTSHGLRDNERAGVIRVGDVRGRRAAGRDSHVLTAARFSHCDRRCVAVN